MRPKASHVATREEKRKERRAFRKLKQAAKRARQRAAAAVENEDPCGPAERIGITKSESWISKYGSTDFGDLTINQNRNRYNRALEEIGCVIDPTYKERILKWKGKKTPRSQQLPEEQAYQRACTKYRQRDYVGRKADVNYINQHPQLVVQGHTDDEDVLDSDNAEHDDDADDGDDADASSYSSEACTRMHAPRMYISLRSSGNRVVDLDRKN